MKVLDLFSGIGGFSLGLERAGFETVAFCEIEEYPKTILKKHWPDVPIFEDIRKLDKEVLDDAGIESVDVICGGFPCQPFSVAGKQGGEKDDRHLWPEMFRLIKELKPNWVIGENVAGFISMALDDVLFNLESEGYETQSFVIPACAVGGIHRRDRVWILANAQHNGAPSMQKPRSKRKAVFNNQERQDKASELEGVCSSSNVAYTSSIRQSTKRPYGKSCDKKARGERQASDAFYNGYRNIEPPTQPPVRHRNDGVPDNVARLKALGNAVVPQIPELIGRAIMEVEATHLTL